jgi:hypothetical protein
MNPPPLPPDTPGGRAAAAQPAPPFLNVYAVVCLAALAVVFFLETQRGWRLTTPLLLAVGLAGVLARVRLGPILLLVMLAAGELFEQQRYGGLGWPRALRPQPLRVADVVRCGAALLYVAAQYRLQALTRHVFPLDPHRREPVPGRPGKTRVVRLKRSPGLATAEEAALLLLTAVVAALVAHALWQVLARQWRILGLPHQVGRLLLLGWVLAVGAFVTAALLGHWRARQMTAAEGELFLQETLWRETRREQRRLNRWLAWAELRRQRKEGP